MFKKLKDKIEEEFKQGPLKFPVSVQQLAQVISPSPSVNSLSDNSAATTVTYPTDTSNVSSDFFSIGGDDESQDGRPSLPLHSIDLTANSPSNMTHSRSRRSSLSSVTSEASSLFPIFESPSNQTYVQSDWESEMEDGMTGQIERISKEQLYQSYKKILNRYNKYKGRYTDLSRHYKDLQHDNVKTKNVLQESQDKALRRIAELREQCQLEQKAKAHLEESLRNDVEERDHIINTLKTKISLLRNGGENNLLLLDSNDKSNEPTDEAAQSEIVSENEITALKLENERLLNEMENLKKIKETACHLIHRCDTTMDEVTENVNNENLKQKMTELKTEILRMKSDNESISDLLSRKIITDDDKKSNQQLTDNNNLLIDFASTDSSQIDQKPDEKDKKIEKLNNLLLKCKEKINNLNVEVKSKNSVIEENGRKLKEVNDELELCKDRIGELEKEVELSRAKVEENALTVAENKMAIHKELEAKEEQIQVLTKDLKSLENQKKKEVEELTRNYEDKIRSMSDDFAREMGYKTDESKKLAEDLKAKEICLSAIESERENLKKKWKDFEAEMKNLAEFMVKKNIDIEKLTISKTKEIEDARTKLEEKLTKLQTNVLHTIKTKESENTKVKLKLTKELEEKMSEISELQSMIQNRDGEKSLEEQNLQRIESCKLEISNLNDKIIELQMERDDLKSAVQELKKEKEANLEVIEKQEESLKVVKEKLSELERLNESLKQECEIKSENIKVLEELKNEKIDAERKLKEHIQKYSQLENENQSLQVALSEKCDKLMKELNDSKEKLKQMENENRVKTQEIEKIINETNERKVQLNEENEALKLELSCKNAEYDEILKKNEELEVLKNKIVNEVDAKNLEVESVKNEKVVLENEVKNLKSALNDREKEGKDLLDSVKAQLESLLVDYKDQTELVNQMKQKLIDSENETKKVDQLEKKLNDLENEKVQLIEENNTLKNESVKLKELEEKLNYLENEKVQLIQENNKLENDRIKLKQLEEKLNYLEKEKAQLTEECNKLENEKIKLKQLEEKLSEFEIEKVQLVEENSRLSEVLKIKTDQLNSDQDLALKYESVARELQVLKNNNEGCLKELERLKRESFDHEKSKNELNQKNENLAKELNEKINELILLSNSNNELLSTFEETRNELESLKKELLHEGKTRTELQDTVNKLTKSKDELNSKFEMELTELKAYKDSLESMNDELSEKVKSLEDEKIRLTSENENKLNVLKNEIKFINNKHEEDIGSFEENRDIEIRRLKDELEISEKTASELLEKLEKLTSERDELKVLHEEKNMKISELESCMQGLKSEMDEKFNGSVKEINFDQGDEVKLLIKQYESAIAERDEEIQNLKVQQLEYDDAIESLKSAKQELKNLRREIIEKDNLIEAKIEEAEKTRQEYENRMINERIDAKDVIDTENKKLEEKLQSQKNEFDKILKSQKADFEKEILRIRNEREESVEEQKAVYEQKIKEIEKNHKKENSEWLNKRKNSNSETSEVLASTDQPEEEELKCTSQLAVAAVESGIGSIELLQKQVLQQAAEIKELKRQHKKEIIELQKIISLKPKRSRRNSAENSEWAVGLENDTEHEYLRNILYEYMMGREQLVLAKVLSAIVKFDKQQTRNVLEKEQHRQTLLGQLGIL